MKHKFSIINFNERVSNYLKTRFNLNSDEQLYSIFEPKLITITFGKKGVEFIYNNNVYKYSLTCSTPEVDSTGAGDAFMSGFIYGLYHHYPIEQCIKFGNVTGSACVQGMGCISNFVNEEQLLEIAGTLEVRDL